MLGTRGPPPPEAAPRLVSVICRTRLCGCWQWVSCVRVWGGLRLLLSALGPIAEIWPFQKPPTPPHKARAHHSKSNVYDHQTKQASRPSKTWQHYKLLHSYLFAPISPPFFVHYYTFLYAFLLLPALRGEACTAVFLAPVPMAAAPAPPPPPLLNVRLGMAGSVGRCAARLARSWGNASVFCVLVRKAWGGWSQSLLAQNRF